MATYQPPAQNYVLPQPIMLLIYQRCQNESSLWPITLKLYKTSKYFWHLFQIFPVKFIVDLLRVSSNIVLFLGKAAPFNSEKIDLHKLIEHNYKIFAEGSLRVGCGHSQFMVSSLLKRFRECSLTSINLHGQSLTLREYKFLVANAEIVELSGSDVKDDCGSSVPIEVLISFIPNLNNFDFSPITGTSIYYYTPNSAQELAKLYLKGKEALIFYLTAVPETFDPNGFVNFIKLNFSKTQRMRGTFHITFNSIHPYAVPSGTARRFVDAIKRRIGEWISADKYEISLYEDISQTVIIYIYNCFAI